MLRSARRAANPSRRNRLKDTGEKARKGIFTTISDFSKHAEDYASAIESSVVLIDGESLAGLMIDYNVGTTVESSYEIKRVDSNYFDEA